MSYKLDQIKERVEFLKITDYNKAELREFYPTLEKYFDYFIEIFLNQVSSNDHLRKEFSDAQKLSNFQKIAKEHWRDLYQGNFTEDYYDRTILIGTLYKAAGLEAQWILGGYAHILNSILEVTIETVGRYPKKLAQLQKSIVKVSYLNLDLIFGVFIKKSDEDKSRTMVHTITSSLEGALQTAVTTVLGLTEEVTSYSHHMEQSLDIVLERMQKASSLNERNQDNVRTVLSSAEHLLNSVQEISVQTNRSTHITAQAVQTSQDTSNVIHHLIGAGTKIGEVVRLISNIASQTNLLALNATIEAARAGEAGKGFAVVAAEVKNLATQTAQATDEISQQVTSIQNVTQDAVNAMDSVGKIINEVNQISSIITNAIEEQTSATMDITQTIQLTARESSSFSASIDEVTSKIKINTQSAADLKTKVTQIRTHMTDLRNELTKIVRQTYEVKNREVSPVEPLNEALADTSVNIKEINGFDVSRTISGV